MRDQMKKEAQKIKVYEDAEKAGILGDSAEKN